MEFIDRISLAKEAATRWKNQYMGASWRGTDKDRILKELIELGDDPKPNDVDKVIGNTSWTDPGSCDECGQRKDKIVQIGEPIDYESRTAHVCHSCLKKAMELMEQGK